MEVKEADMDSLDMDHQLLCSITDLVQLDQLEDLEVHALGMAVQGTDLVMDQEHLQLLAMVLHKALAMDNLINSSSIILLRASSHLRHQLNRRRSNSTEKFR